MSAKRIDITNKYSYEIQDIFNKLQQLKDGRIYELTNANAQMDGYLSNNVIHLTKMINDLINKIEYGKDSTTNIISENLNKHRI